MRTRAYSPDSPHGGVIECSHLDAVVYPEDRLLRAEVIAYYLTVAPTLGPHLARRSMLCICYPRGIDGARTTLRRPSRPGHAGTETGSATCPGGNLSPDVIDLLRLVAEGTVELHLGVGSKRGPGRPAVLVFDLDPCPGTPFGAVRDVACRLREHLEQRGYRPFVKTSGLRGVHVVCPVEPVYTPLQCRHEAAEFSRAFVQRFPRLVTLRFEGSGGAPKTLIDIYRNGSDATVVAPYSLRAADGAPVSMPLSWAEFETVEDPGAYHIGNVPDLLAGRPDAWSGLAEAATALPDAAPVVGAAWSGLGGGAAPWRRGEGAGPHGRRPAAEWRTGVGPR